MLICSSRISTFLLQIIRKISACRKQMMWRTPGIRETSKQHIAILWLDAKGSFRIFRIQIKDACRFCENRKDRHFVGYFSNPIHLLQGLL